MDQNDYVATYADDPGATPELHDLNLRLIDLTEDVAAYGDAHAGDRHALDPAAVPAFEHLLSDDLRERIGQGLDDVAAAGTLDTEASPFVAQSILTRSSALTTALELHAAAIG